MALLHRHKALLYTSTHQKHHPRRTNENPFRRPRRNQTVLESTVILKAQKAFCTQTSRPGKQPLPLRHNLIKPESPWPFSPHPCRRRKQIYKLGRIHHASLRMLRHRILLRSLQDRAHRRHPLYLGHLALFMRRFRQWYKLPYLPLLHHPCKHIQGRTPAENLELPCVEESGRWKKKPMLPVSFRISTLAF